MIKVTVLSVFAVVLVQAAASWKAMDPEQTLYVYKRCYEDHLPAGDKKLIYLKTWNAWKLEPNDAITQCYVKCVLTGLQLYDDREKKFKPETIPIQHDAFKTLNEANARDVEQFSKALAKANAGTGSCIDLYNAYVPVHNKHVNVTRKLYHGTVVGAARIYAAMPEIKQKGESYFAFCKKRAWNGKNKPDERYKLTGSAELRKEIDCIFRGLRYMDDGGLKVDEVVRDFNLINRSDLEPEVRSILASCQGTEAYDYYSCLVNSAIKEDFKKAFDFHELRSADYAYLLRGKVYEGPEKVKLEMQKINTTVHSD
uniref:Long form D7 salivary protein n=1 Tax=Anopheles farauti TaxID=69004 RepID=A0A182QZX9_9DIPT